MHESLSSPESNKVEKQQVIDEYRKIIENGILTPDDMDLSSPEVIEANEKYETYFEQRSEEAKDDEEAQLRVNFDRTLFYLDAGFTDPSYTEEVLHDFAQQDIEDAEEKYPHLASEMKQRVKEYADRLIPGTSDER